MFKVALIQMTSSADIAENLAAIEKGCQQAAKSGVELVVTPENALLFADRTAYHQFADLMGAGTTHSELARIAQQYGVMLLIGSMPVLRQGKVFTTTLLFSREGEVVADYDKLHMFDVDVADSHHCYRESDSFESGSEVVVAKTAIGNIGLSICYDLRFPALYQQLRLQGANIICVPAAFTKVTGEAHWELLLRARAIETQCWVLACGQTGKHPCGRETWGHSMVVDPWGRIVATQKHEAGVLIAEIDLSQCQQLRQNMPLIEHNRFQSELKPKS